MNLVIIDYSFFEMNSNLSAGLISGLIKLKQYGFSTALPGGRKIKSSILEILKLEGIELLRSDRNLIKKHTQAFYVKTKENKELLNTESIIVSEDSLSPDFGTVANNLCAGLRVASLERKTKETKISITLALDRPGDSEISTGIGFFDHLLELFAKHSNIYLNLKVEGDLIVDEHHSVEDTGIVLGQALLQALGNKKGIRRYGYYLPMDEAIARCAVDLGGRAYLNFKCKFKREKVGEFPTELTEEFFRGLSGGLKANIFLRAKGKNDHHKIEGMIKAFAKSVNVACAFDERSGNLLPTTKGIL